jgi:hypothetical protein
MVLTIERRTSPRITPMPSGTGVLIMDADEKCMMPAKVLNLSSDGGLISPGILVPTGRGICLLFEKVVEAGWIDAVVVRGGRPGQVGIRFLSRLSPELLRAATAEGQPGRNAAEGQTPCLGNIIPTW